jgi:hypothetical protein
VQVPQRSLITTGSHNINQKENGEGGGDPKSRMRRNIAINTKLKDTFYEGVAHRVRQKIPIK